MKILKVIVFSAIIAAYAVGSAHAASRIKDLVHVEGARDNVLIGYGLVVGLNGTGDDIKSLAFTEQSLIGMLERLGVNTRDGKMDPDNIAAVMVTANLPPFARSGSRIDVTVSSMGDADSLAGGTLLITPLIGADGEVYAVAQGTVAASGYGITGNAAKLVKNTPTNGRIANGAIVERETGFEFNALEKVKLALRNPDFTTSRRISEAINAYLGTPASRPLDSGTVEVDVIDSYRANAVAMITKIEQLRVQPDYPAKVVIDELSGTVVIGDSVRISKVAIAQGNLTIRVAEEPEVSQPLPFTSAGEAVTVPRTEIAVDEGAEGRLQTVGNTVTLQELVEGLNALGVGPRDLIMILQAVKASGAIQAQIEVM